MFNMLGIFFFKSVPQGGARDNSSVISQITWCMIKGEADNQTHRTSQWAALNFFAAFYKAIVVILE